jgi:quercetin dioxygenase-like cupin family protein
MRIPAHTVLAMLLVCTACSSLSLQEHRRPQVMVVTAFEDAKFIPVAPGRSDSAEIAILWGDPRTGPSAMLIRLKKGPLPMHTHFSDYHLVVLQGLVKHWSAEETEEDAKPLRPGSYWFQPGNAAHADSCLSDQCVAHLVWAGKRDGKLVEPRRK